MTLVALPGRLYQSVPGFEDHLAAELGSGVSRVGPLFQGGGEAGGVFWYRNCWQKPLRAEFSSIGEAAGFLRGIQRNWAACLHTCFRRGALIKSKLPPISGRPKPFPWLPPQSPVGAWTLLDENTLVASPVCSSPFPGGVPDFEHDREGPPSRAYLKLWEAFCQMRRLPAPGERCLDAGASPGGWSWALARLGAEVLAVDPAPPAGSVAAMPGVEYRRGDAFTLKPSDIGRIDWLFCDAACYPAKLYGWIEKWLESGLCRRFVCTLKMQGQVGAGTTGGDTGITGVDFDTPKRFAAIPGGRVVHLYHNRHELTWLFDGSAG